MATVLSVRPVEVRLLFSQLCHAIRTVFFLMFVRPFFFLTLLATGSGACYSQQKTNPALPCFEALARDERFSIIREKVALSGAMDEMRRMTKRGDRASDEEKVALTAWRHARADCQKDELPYLATRDSEIAALAQEHFARVQTLIGQLQDGSFSYGEFSKRRIDLYQSSTARIEQARQKIVPAQLIPKSAGR